MAPITVVSSLLLIALGLWAYLTGTPQPGHEHVSMTALIPAFAGLPLLILGLVAFKDSFRKHAMHAAVILGLLGFLGAGYMLIDLLFIKQAFTTFTLDPVDPAHLSSKKLLVNGLMAAISGVFVVLCVRSFIVARIAQRKKAEATPSQS